MIRKIYRFLSITDDYKHIYRLMKYLRIKKKKVKIKKGMFLGRLRGEILKKNSDLYSIDDIDKFYIKNVLHGRRPRSIMVKSDNGNYYIE